MRWRIPSDLKKLRKYLPVKVEPKFGFDDAMHERTGHAGECTRDGRRVTLCSDMTELEMRDTLIHEWAHAMAKDHPGPDHGAEWGVAYSMAYRVVVEGWTPKIVR